MEYSLIDRGKEFPYIAFEHPRLASVIPRDFGCKSFEPIHRPMRPLPEPARERICYEHSIEERVQHAVDSVVKQTIPDTCLVVDTPRLRVIDLERLIRRMSVAFVDEIMVKRAASFLNPQEKHPYVRLAIKKLDALKIVLMILWESKSLDDKRYIALSVKLDEIGRNLGGWLGQLSKQNSPMKTGEK